MNFSTISKQDLQDTDKEEQGARVVQGNDAEEADIKDETIGVNSGSRGAYEEFVSESYLASSKDIAEADESIKKLGVAGMRRVLFYRYVTVYGP